MKQRRLPEGRPLITLVLISFLAVACSPGGLTGVGVKQKASELVFGIPPVAEVVAPPNTIPFGNIESESFGPSAGELKPSTPLPPPPEACPEAPIGAAPDEPAPEAIFSAPKAGVYQYVYTVRLPKQGGVSSSGFETRTVRNVQVTNAAGPDFTFEIFQKLVIGPSDVEVISRFSVNQTAPAPRAGPSLANPPSARGIFLTNLRRTVRQGANQTVGTLTPNPPLKYSPLPVRIGFEGSFDTTSVDSATFTTIRHQGEVLRFEAVDACGTMVSSWFVDATQTLTTPQGQTSVTDLNYGIGTQFGGLMILENIKFPATDPEFVFDSRIGNLEPKPG